MQFIFGDNRTSYSLIYTDDDKNNANRVRELLKFPISPNEKFNTIGFLPYGTNSNNAFFFCIKKDRELSRSVYYMHGFYKEMTPEYLCGKGLIDDICMKYINQEEYNRLRDGGAVEEYLSLNYELSVTDAADIHINREILLEIIANIYQKNKVLIAIDDEKYSDEYVALLLKKIFVYLTPSLKKSCSYISAVVKTGNMEFVLNFVPKSMLEDKREPYIDIDDAGFERTKKNVYHQIAETILDLSNERREEFFENFEFLFFGGRSVYKKQNFEDYYLMLAEKNKEKLETFVDNVLLKRSDIERSDMIELVENVLQPVFTSEIEVINRLNVTDKNILDPIKLFTDKELFFYKLYLFTNENTARRLNEYIISVCNSMKVSYFNVESLHKAVCSFNENKAREGKRSYEEFFYNIFSRGFDILRNKTEKYELLLQKTKHNVVELLNRRETEPVEPSRIDALCTDLAEIAIVTVKNEFDVEKINVKDALEEFARVEIEKFNKAFASKTNGAAKYPAETIISCFKEIDNDFENKSISDVLERNLITAMSYQEDYLFIVDAFLAQYFVELCKKNEFLIKSDRVFEKITDLRRLRGISNRIENYDPVLALLFAILYCKSGEFVFEKVRKNTDAINELSREKILRYTELITGVLTTRSRNIENYEIYNMILSENKKGTNLYVLFDAIVKTGSNKKSKKSKKNVLLIVSSVIIVALATIVLLIVFGIIGGDGNLQKNDNKSSPTEQVSESQNTSLPTDVLPEGEPTASPEEEPTGELEGEPTASPEEEPTGEPEGEPTASPEGEPTDELEGEPTASPEGEPTDELEGEPAGEPEEEPTGELEEEPTGEPEGEPTDETM